MTKEQERAELHKTIWRIANDLRGSVDGWDFKSYVLGMLFYRFISENITRRANRLVEEAEGGSFDYTRMADADAEVARAQMVGEIGYFILPSELFCNVQQRAAQDEAWFLQKYMRDRKSVRAWESSRDSSSTIS